MYCGKTIIQNPTGLHARPASCFAKQAKEFSSSIIVRKSCGEEANAKSVVMVMGLGIGRGEQVEIIATGCDEQEAVQALLTLVNDGLGE